MVNKALGQHWLYNREILDEIAELAAVGGEKLCVEIGPGLGTLTSSLLKRFDRVLAVEFDADLALKLPGSFPGKNLNVVHADFLKFDLGRAERPYVVAGNIPYYITSPILEHILTAENPPERAVILMQKEVAERVVNGGDESMLSLKCKNRADVELGPIVPRDEFTPPPKVDSRVLILKPHAPLVPQEVFKLIGKGFCASRKKLINNLTSLKPAYELEDIFLKCNINVNARPADLKLEDWYKIYQKMI